MYKVKLVYKNSENIAIKELYNGFDAEVITAGNDDGVYYVKNFPKDLIYVISEGDNIDYLAKNGIVVNEHDLVINNVIIQPNTFGRSYTVEPLDNLEKISNDFNISKEEIIRINKLKTEKLFVGQRLIIDK